ncbi:MAG: ABC transporter substrate-binding protein [Rhizobiaceae bacterium]|nr:ABC transporter substrate-binding protein [Rhizobiaceae bacterium]
MLAGPLASLPNISLAGNPTSRPLHGLSAFGELKYGPDYSHFDFVNPEAPKGGTFNFGISSWGYNQNPQTFDTLNTFVLKGNAPPRMELCFDALMVRAVDEPTAIYGQLAETVEISEDRNSYTFKLRSEAKWHDGTAVTADDVAFSYELLKKDGHPEIGIVLANLESAQATSSDTVVLAFNGKQSDRSILTVAAMPVLSKAYYGANDFLASTMEPPLSSGPYRVKRTKAGTFIEYERVEGYWAKDMPFAKGQNNFEVLRLEFYRERQAAFEAFKKGVVNFREELTSKTWATEYDFPAIQDGRAIQKLFDAEKVASFQAWAVNQRRQKFTHPKTVQAIGHCFDFEWTNDNFFFNAYQRSQSFFENSEFKAIGKPEGKELALLKSLSASLDDAVFDDVPVQPVSDGSGRDRKLLRRASQLLGEAGWKRDGSKLVDDKGEQLAVEFLIRSPTFERILGKFVANLKALGADATIRLVDPAQYQQRLDTYDFDITGMAFRFGATPTSESMQQFFGAANADREGNRNFAGIKNPAVDEIISRIDDASDREELAFTLRALDRVLRSTYSWIPNWKSSNHRIAYWDMFGYPEPKPDYAFPIETYWWFDEQKAKAIGKG